jgi:hypothetical protein
LSSVIDRGDTFCRDSCVPQAHEGGEGGMIMERLGEGIEGPLPSDFAVGIFYRKAHGSRACETETQ